MTIGILATEAITMIFWFAGFIALANLLNDFEGGCGKWGPCSAAIAGDVFAAFEWFVAISRTLKLEVFVKGFSADGK